MGKQIFREITPLSEKDCFLVFFRTKKKFDFPIHVHSEYEINLIEDAKGAQRIVGDSVEVIDDLDLTLITGSDLEHAWLSHECTSTEVKELTIQFHPDLLSDNLLVRNQFKSVADLFEKAKYGVTFPRETIQKIKPQLEQLAQEPKGAFSVLQLFSIIYELSLSADMRVLATEGIREEPTHYNSRRIERAYAFIHENYQNEIRLEDVADCVGMSEVAFSRFVKKRTGKNFIDVLNDIRLGHVSKMLVDTTHSVSEICFSCGFNNLSNFNRIFRKKKGCTPKEYRENYKKNRYML